MSTEDLNFIIATDIDHLERGIMTDRNKVSNGLYRFGESPVIQKMFGLMRSNDDERLRALYNAHSIFIDYREIVDSRYIIATNVASHPDQWTGELDGLEKNLHTWDLPDRANLFECMPEKCLNDLQSGQAILLLDQTHEGYNASWMWQWFYQSVAKYNVPPQSVIYITGDLMSPDLHNAWADEHHIPVSERICVFGYSLFEEGVYLASQRENEWAHEYITYEDHIAYKTANLDKIKTFNCLQKRPRNHRLWLFRELYDRNLLDNSICTMNRIEEEMLYDQHQNFVGSLHFQDEYIDNETINKLNEILPLLPTDYGHYQNSDATDFADLCSGKWQMMLNKDILLDSWVSVISEAAADERQCFCSEKIFKPLIQEHPFMVWGDKHTMAKLREMGYQTFDNWWSESWDSKPMRHRLNGMCEVLEELSTRSPEEMFQMYTDMQDVLKHNAQHMKNKSTVDIDHELQFIARKVLHG